MEHLSTQQYTVVQVDGLHGPCVHLILQEQVALCDRFAFQVMKKCLVAVLFTYQVYHHHAQQKKRLRL